MPTASALLALSRDSPHSMCPLVHPLHALVPQPTSAPTLVVTSAACSVVGAGGYDVSSVGRKYLSTGTEVAIPRKKVMVVGEAVGEKRFRIKPEQPRVRPLLWRRREVDWWRRRAPREDSRGVNMMKSLFGMASCEVSRLGLVGFCVKRSGC